MLLFFLRCKVGVGIELLIVVVIFIIFVKFIGDLFIIRFMIFLFSLGVVFVEVLVSKDEVV